MQPAPDIYGFTIQATSTINAPPEDVWSVLSDFAQYGVWNTFVPAVQSTSQIGSPLVMRVQISRGWRVRVTTIITAFEPPSRLAWKTRYPRWLLYSERSQVITQIDSQLTHYQTSETFTGILTPLLKILLSKNLQLGFERIAQNLKIRVETLCNRTT